LLFASVVGLVIYGILYSFPRIKKGVLIEKVHRDNANWTLYIQDKKGRVGKLYVDKETYGDIKLGDIYTKKRGDKHAIGL